MKKNINKIVKKVINEAVPLKNFHFDGNGNMSYDLEKPKFKVNTDTGEMSWGYSNGQKADTSDFTSSYSGDENMNGLNSDEQNNVQPQQNAEPVQNNVPQSDEELREAFANGKLEIKYANGQPLEDNYYSHYHNYEQKIKGKRIKVLKFNQYGTAIIGSYEKHLFNIINKEGILLSDQWFYIYNGEDLKDSEGRNGLIKLYNKREELTNLMYVKNAKLVSDIWGDYIGFPDENGLMYLRTSNGDNFLKPDGTFLSEEWFKYADNIFEDGFSCVKVRDKGYNYIDINGNYLSNIWFLQASRFYNGFGTVSILNKRGNHYDTQNPEIKYFNYEIDKNANLYNRKGKIIKNCKKENRGFFGNLFNRRRNESIDRIVSEVLNEVRQKQMNEEGCGGATSCGGVGVDGNNTINVPMGKVQRRKIYNTNEDLIRNSEELNEVKTMMSRLNKIKK